MGMKYKTSVTMVEIDSLISSPDFKEVLGFLNTSKNKQLKGAGGNEK